MIKLTSCHVKVLNGIPQLFINGKVHSPLLFFTAVGIPDKEYICRMQIQEAARRGMHLFTVACNMPLLPTDGERVFTSALHAMNLVIECDPEARILLRISLSLYGAEALEWNVHYPGDAMEFAFIRETPYSNDMADESSVIGRNQTSISVASDPWAEEAKAAIRDLHQLLMSNPLYDEHLLGYHIGSAETGEWFHFGLRERGVDISETNTRGFQEYLRQLYVTPDRLSAAWEQSINSFDEAMVPHDIPGNDRMQPATRTLFTESGDQRFIDYCDYASEIMCSRMLELTSACREVTKGQKLIVCFYGYHFELYDARTGHFRLHRVLQSPDIDALSSPVSYTDRNHGGVGGLMSPVDSIVLHGKLWFVENDIRSCVVVRRNHSDDWDWVKPVNSIERYNHVLTREAGQQLVHGLGCWYMDLMAQGWHAHPLIWDHIQDLKKLHDGVRPHLRPLKADVALVVDEKALSYVAHADALGVNVMYRMRHTAYRAGISFGLYTSDDVEAGNVDAQLFIYLTPYRIDHERVGRIQEMASSHNAAIMFLHGFGITAPEDVRALTGMDLRTLDGAMMDLTMDTTSWLELDPGTVLLEESGYSSGLPQCASPASFVSPCEHIRVLARYRSGRLKGKIGAACTLQGGLMRIFVGGMLLTPAGLRELCRLAGVHIYNNGDDVFFAGNGVYCLHANREDGLRHIALPTPSELIAFPSGQRYGPACDFAFPMEAYSTLLLFDAYQYRKVFEAI